MPRAKTSSNVLFVLAVLLGQSLIMTTTNGDTVQETAYPIMYGFPIDIAGHVTRSSPTVADIDADGDNELLVANYDGQVYAWNANGTLLAGYPLETGGRIIGHLALADLNDDGDLEIIAGVGSVDLGANGKVYVWQPDGTLLTGWPQTVARFGDKKPAKVPTVAVADVDNDSDLEVIAGTNNNTVEIPNPPEDVPDLYVWHHTGELMAGNWPAADGPAILGTVAVADLDKDGQLDIATGRDYDWVFAYNVQGNHLIHWPVETLVPETGDKNDVPRIVHTRSTPTLADLDHDGELEYIVAGVRFLPGETDIISGDLLVLEPNGSRRTGWETPASGGDAIPSDIIMQQAVAVADLDHNGQLDIVVPTHDGYIRAYTADKTLLWEFNYAQGKLIHASEPVIGDIDDDGLYEVVFGSFDPLVGSVGPVGLWILENDGAPKTKTPLPVEATGIMAAPALIDLDKDGSLDIIAASRTGTIYAWDTGSQFNPRLLPWPVARHDIQRTGFYDPRSFAPDLSVSTKTANVSIAEAEEAITYTLRLVRIGAPLTSTIHITDVVPPDLSYVPGSLSGSHGMTDDSNAPSLHWTGRLSDTSTADVTYVVTVLTDQPSVIVNSATVNGGVAGQIILDELVLVNGTKRFLPLIFRNTLIR